MLLLVLGAVGLFAFIAFASDDVRKLALAGVWGLLALAAAGSIIYSIGRSMLS